MNDNTKEGSIFNLTVDDESRYQLKEIAKWARFLGIVGIIISCIIFIAALWLFFTQIQLGGMSNLILGLSYLVACFLYFYPIMTLYSFGKKMRMAMLQNDQVLMNQSLKKLKNCFLYIGITTIILIATYGIIAIAGLVYYASSI